MKQAAGIHDLKLPMLIPGITVTTGADRFRADQADAADEVRRQHLAAVRRSDLRLRQLRRTLGRGRHRRLNHKTARARIGYAERAQRQRASSDCTISRSRPAASGASGPISPSISRPVSAAAVRTWHPAPASAVAGHGGADARREFGCKRLAIFDAHGIEFGVNRLGDRRKGKPAVAQRAHRKSRDRCRKRRQRTGRSARSAAQRSDFASGHFLAAAPPPDRSCPENIDRRCRRDAGPPATAAICTAAMPPSLAIPRAASIIASCRAARRRATFSVRR